MLTNQQIQRAVAEKSLRSVAAEMGVKDTCVVVQDQRNTKMMIRLWHGPNADEQLLEMDMTKDDAAIEADIRSWFAGLGYGRG